MATPRPASLARRALPMLVIAGASGALLVKLDNPASSALPAADPAGNAAVPDASTAHRPSGTAAASSADDGATASSSAATLPRTTPTAAKGDVTPPTTSAGRPSASTAAPAAPATAAASTACTGEPVNGPTVNTRWGPVQVAAVFDGGGALCDVQVLQYPDSHGKSVRINQRALPVLKREALAAQSADIDIVTGATITSDAYAQSLQSILDNR